MPELPEVETVRRGLAPVLEGARLTRVEARRPDLRFPLPERFVERLTGVTVIGLHRRAKYLLASLDSEETLVAHLGMSGRFTVFGAVTQAGGDPFYYSSPPNAVHTHVIFETAAGARVEYNDPRRFGYMTVVETAALNAHPYFAGLGPEPLGPGLTHSHLASAFQGRRQSVKTMLLDQRVVAGLGNIYVCEALFRAKVAPEKPAGAVTRAKIRRLVEEIRAVLQEAIEAGGSSLKDYAQANGALGYFQHRFRVYDREGEGCHVCGAAIVRLTQSGRSTFFCGRCQR